MSKVKITYLIMLQLQVDGLQCIRRSKQVDLSASLSID